MLPSVESKNYLQAYVIWIAALLMLGSFLYALPSAKAQSAGIFEGPHSDQGLDTNGNSLFDFLELNVSVNVTSAGSFRIVGNLYDESGFQWITSNSTSVTLSGGLQNVILRFEGIDLGSSSIDGPYNISLTLENDAFAFQDSDTHITNPYNATDFERGPIIFVPPHTDWGLDTDGNGKYNFLQVNVSVNTTEPGYYMIFGILGSMGWKVRLVNLTAGDHIIQLNFSGIGIFVSGSNGPYTVFLMASSLTFGEEPEFGATGSHTTMSYNFTDFEFGTIAELNGNVYDASTSLELSGVQVWLANSTHGWVIQTETNETGSYTISAFEGDFVLMVSEDGFQDVAVPVTISGTTSQDVSLDAQQASVMNLSLEFSAWDSVSMDFEGLMYADNQSQRFMIDQFVGNGDLFVDQQESQLWLELFTQFFEPINDTKDVFEVDGSIFDLVDGTWNFDIVITGEVTSTEPMIMIQNGSYVAASLIPNIPVHNVTFNVTYDTENETWINTLTFPSQWVLQDYQDVNGVKITGLNENTVTVDPELRPTGEPEWAFVQLNVTTDTTPPNVTDVWASPDPQEVFEDVTISANITENSRLVGVSVNITDPAGTVLGNFTMTSVDKDPYTYTSSFDQLGLFNFTVWAEDDSGFVDSLAGNFTVHDTTSPVPGTPTAEPSPQEVGQTVQFSTEVTDNFMVDAVTIAVYDPDGNLVGNFTMTLVDGNYTYSDSFNELGTFSYTIWATDTSGNYASIAGEFVVQDSTPPVADAGEAIAATIGDEVTLDASGSTDNHRIVNYTWTFQVGDQTVTLYGSKPKYTFTESGTYTITLTVQDEAGNIDTTTVTVTIEPELLLPTNVIIIGGVAAVIIGLGAVYYLMRRRGPKPPQVLE
ncbi:MAG: PKD domain-containing protein [Thermoplasmata archaeon]